MIIKFLKKLSSTVQQAKSSYQRHNAELETKGKYDIERKIALENIQTDAINGPGLKIKKLLKKHPNIKVGVDIGSGAGWATMSLSKLVENVISIEPSKAGIKIAEKIGEELGCTNITWYNGFAEQILPKLKLEQPTLFMTGCVFNHMRDQEVAQVCQAITQNAPTGSVLSFAENWGDEWHQLMWHVRTKDWWQSKLPGWKLDFHGPAVAEKDEYKGRYYQGIQGVKVN
jgi:hypothetical protein